MAKTILVIDLEGNILTHLSADIDYSIPNDGIARPVGDTSNIVYGDIYSVDLAAEPFGDAVEYFSSLVKNMADWNWSKATEADGTTTGRFYNKGPHSTKAEWRKSMKGKR